MAPLTAARPNWSAPETLAAEAAASSALALVQSPAVWAAVETLALIAGGSDRVREARRDRAALGDLLAGAMVTRQDTTQALALLESAERTARTWRKSPIQGASRQPPSSRC